MKDLQQTVQDLLARADRDEESLKIVRGYNLIGELGKGGMGAVFLLQHPESRDQAALKVMRPHLAIDPDARKMFQREVANMMALRHGNIVTFRGASNSGNSSAGWRRTRSAAPSERACPVRVAARKTNIFATG